MAKPKPPSLDDLQLLLVLAERHTVSAAAREVGLSQPALSRRLQVFQQPNPDGHSLLERRGSTLQFTDEGRAALPAIRDILAQYDELLGFIRGTRGMPQLVRIGVGTYTAHFYLPGTLARLRKAKAACRIEPEQMRGRERINRIVDGTLDLAIVSHDPTQVESLARQRNPKVDLVVEHLTSQPCCAVAHRDSTAGRKLKSLAAGDRVPDAWLGSWQLVGFDRFSGNRQRIQRQLRRDHVELAFQEAATVGGYLTAIEFARLKLGVAVVPFSCAPPHSEEPFVARLLGETHRNADCLIHLNRTLNRSQRRIIEQLQETAKQKGQDVQKRLRKW